MALRRPRILVSLLHPPIQTIASSFFETGIPYASGASDADDWPVLANDKLGDPPHGGSRSL